MSSNYMARNTISAQNHAPSTAGLIRAFGGSKDYLVTDVIVTVEVASTGNTSVKLQNTAGTTDYAEVSLTSSDAAGTVKTASVPVASRQFAGGTGLKIVSVTNDASAQYSVDVVTTINS